MVPYTHEKPQYLALEKAKEACKGVFVIVDRLQIEMKMNIPICFNFIVHQWRDENKLIFM